MPQSEDQLDHSSAERSSLYRYSLAARGGDAQAFSKLCERIEPLLYAWASIRVKGAAGRHADAQDIVQETLLRAMSNFASYDPKRASFRVWVLGIARNVLLEMYRTRGRQLRLDPLEATAREALLAMQPASVTTVSARLSRDEGLQAFLAYAGELEDVDRKILLMCCFEDLPCAEVASRVDMNVEAVTKRWQRLRARLTESPRMREILTDS